MADPLLELKGISKRFPGVVALDRVSMSVHPGEVVALIGENGAGKSTLMKILGGVYEADEGQIHIDGQPVTIGRVSDAIRLGIGFIHQELNVLDNLDVAGNIFLGRERLWGGPLRLIDRGRMFHESERYLRELGVNIHGSAPLRSLSLAQQQMVEIAKALSLEARLLIMDEPTSSLTLSETQRLLETVARLRGRGVSIIYISHRLSEVQRCADRVVALRDGRNAGELVGDGIEHENMVRLMVGRDLKKRTDHHSLSQGDGFFQVKELRTRAHPESAVSFEVNRGEILGFAGLVGAGRSELAQAIFGVEPPLAGQVFLDGVPLKIRSSRDAIAAGISLVPEDRRSSGLVTEMSVRENITLPGLRAHSRFGLTRRSSEALAADEQCRSLKVKTPNLEAKVLNLSGGNQQKVVLGKWLALRPKVMIFDEPTRGIDVGAKSEIYTLMRRLADQGVAVMMISSDMEEVLGISDRVAVMHAGRIMDILDHADCSEEAILRLAVGRGSGRLAV
jgi:ribose transport system ATP-binding protein